MVYNKEFAEMWDALPAKIADKREDGTKPEFIEKASDLIFPNQVVPFSDDDPMTITATLKEIQVSRGNGGMVGKALGIKPKTTHFKLDTPQGYKSITDLRIIHAKDDFIIPKEKPDGSRDPEKLNLYTHKVQVTAVPLSFVKSK
jgi:hypothetical protein